VGKRAIAAAGSRVRSPPRKRSSKISAPPRAPVRRYLPGLIDLVWNGTINPGQVFDLTLSLDQLAEGYRAMDERRAIEALLRP
jgi:threonine dehydrogenase-like Zn-dependent dehydrogenase